MEQQYTLSQAAALALSTSGVQRELGLQLLIEAQSGGDREAAYALGRVLAERELPQALQSAAEGAVRRLAQDSGRGVRRAAVLLDRICARRYEEAFAPETRPAPTDCLTDPDGRPIEFTRKGLFLPVKAVLLRERDGFHLHLKTSVRFTYPDELENRKRFERAVLSGIRDWRGTYRVFGGHRLRVTLDVRSGWGGIRVVPMTNTLSKDMERITIPLASARKQEQLRSILENRRSFATGGLRWSPASRKLICIQSTDGRFRDYDEIRAVARHEFGHALGLGDLYESRFDGLPGVPKGTCRKLDPYHTYGKNYHLVMCDHHCPVTHPDLEMVLLAFRDGIMQNYEPRHGRGVRSAALMEGDTP